MTTQIHSLLCENATNPLGIDVVRPRLSWQLSGDHRGIAQTAYRIIVADSLEQLAANKGNIWDSKRVTSDKSLWRHYKGPDLQSRQRCYWKVIVWDERNQRTAWSEPAFWEMGLLSEDDWQAKWVTPDIEENKEEMQPCPLLRTEFAVAEDVVSARLYVTALGLYEVQLNGRSITPHCFTPGWTNYHKRILYQTYDVVDHLTVGQNAVGAILGDGWYRGYLAGSPSPSRNKYGDTLALLLQLELRYANGRSQIVTSNPNWRATSDGPIRHSDIYMGELYDARREQTGWAAAGFDDRDWAGVRVYDGVGGKLVAQTGTAVRPMHTLRPVSISRAPSGETIVDFGQNLVGRVRLQLTGEVGTTVTLRHAEVLDAEGNLYTANLRAAKQEVTYILRGEGMEIYEPHFTFQGFRYVAIEGAELTEETVTAVVLYSDLTASGHFECSHPLINQLQQNIVWGQRGNFLEVPTDCPQRDERLGWTGDAQVFAATACFNMDVSAFFTRWLHNLRDDQREDGAVPFVVPHVLPDHAYGAAGWADAVIIVPWTVYLSYGNIRILAENYPAMQRWLAYVYTQAGDDFIWSGDFHFGDWLARDRDDLGTPFGLTETDLIATAYYAYSAALLANIARVLNRNEDADLYEAIAAQVRTAFCDEFVTKNGRISGNTQTAYVLTLMFDLLPEAQRPEAARRLVANIRERDTHLATGFLGTPYLCHVLTRFGYLDVAYDLLLQERCPSWLYPVAQGATTIWERWDGLRLDGTFQNPAMNSFNHCAYGAIGHWLYSAVAGIQIDGAKPGYKHTLIQPQLGGNLDFAKAELVTGYGRLASHWQLNEETLTLDVTIPPNTTATIVLPMTDSAAVLEGERPLEDVEDIRVFRNMGDKIVIEVGSGNFTFGGKLTTV